MLGPAHAHPLLADDVLQAVEAKHADELAGGVGHEVETLTPCLILLSETVEE